MSYSPSDASMTLNFLRSRASTSEGALAQAAHDITALNDSLSRFAFVASRSSHTKDCQRSDALTILKDVLLPDHTKNKRIMRLT